MPTNRKDHHVGIKQKSPPTRVEPADVPMVEGGRAREVANASGAELASTLQLVVRDVQP